VHAGELVEDLHELQAFRKLPSPSNTPWGLAKWNILLGGREDWQRCAFIHVLYVSRKVLDGCIAERQINTVINQLNEGSPANWERILCGRPRP
jgi:hypothetical protein